MTEENKIALAAAQEEVRHALAHLEAANRPGAYVRDHIESAAYRMKIALRKCAVVHNAEFSPISARHQPHPGRNGELDRRMGSDEPVAYQTVAPAITRADSRHIMAREVVRDAS
jgi:hypothetical protein